MKTYVIACQKGGCGKTSTSHALSVGLCNRGFKVLGIDLDSQCNLSQVLGVDPLGDIPTIYDVLKGNISARDAAQEIRPNLSFISGGLQLSSADMEFTQTGRETMLKRALKPIQSDFDFCIIDTPCHLGMTVINALAASNSVIVTATPDLFCLQGLLQLGGVVNSVREFCNEGLTVEGILLTRYSPRTNTTRAIMQNADYYAEALQTKVFETRIREATAIRDTQLLQTDLFTDYEKAGVTQDYAKFIDELLESEVL